MLTLNDRRVPEEKAPLARRNGKVQMYFDAVLNDLQMPLFNGTPEETKKWIEDNKPPWNLRVVVGETQEVLTVHEYMNTKG